MFLDKGDVTEPLAVAPVPAVLVAILVIPTMVLGLYWEPVIRIAAAASNALISF
jgi:hypothetical protein